MNIIIGYNKIYKWNSQSNQNIDGEEIARETKVISGYKTELIPYLSVGDYVNVYDYNIGWNIYKKVIQRNFDLNDNTLNIVLQPIYETHNYYNFCSKNGLNEYSLLFNINNEFKKINNIK